ncbi:MAG: hypothetical protein A2149_07540, partial [Candidatus Schekmanbacteria bacterium RBG_16_38_11]
MKSIKLKIAKIIIELSSEKGKIDFPQGSAHKNFVVEDGKPHLSLKAYYGTIPDIPLGEELFNSKSVWRLYSKGNSLIFTLTSQQNSKKPYSIAVLDKDFKRGEIYIDLPELSSYIPNPLDYPLDELLMVGILSRGKGILVHSSCIDDRGLGMLFTGTSGAGKSTMAQVWSGKEGVKLLTDERAIVRKEGKNFFAYGTPWHGTANIHSPARVCLKKIFFIKHGKENHARVLDKIDSASRLIVRAFPTYWDTEGMKFTLDL